METVVSVLVNDIRGVEGQLLVRVDAHQEGRDRCLQVMMIMIIKSSKIHFSDNSHRSCPA